MFFVLRPALCPLVALAVEGGLHSGGSQRRWPPACWAGPGLREPRPFLFKRPLPGVRGFDLVPGTPQLRSGAPPRAQGPAPLCSPASSTNVHPQSENGATCVHAAEAAPRGAPRADGAQPPASETRAPRPGSSRPFPPSSRGLVGHRRPLQIERKVV